MFVGDPYTQASGVNLDCTQITCNPRLQIKHAIILSATFFLEFQAAYRLLRTLTQIDGIQPLAKIQPLNTNLPATDQGT